MGEKGTFPDGVTMGSGPDGLVNIPLLFTPKSVVKIGLERAPACISDSLASSSRYRPLPIGTAFSNLEFSKLGPLTDVTGTEKQDLNQFYWTRQQINCYSLLIQYQSSMNCLSIINRQ